jgi:hypothetical protein
MTDDNGKITIDSEQFNKLLEIVSKGGSSTSDIGITGDPRHVIEGEDLKKAWFTQMVISIEKLSQSTDKAIEKLEQQMEKDANALEEYKKDTIKPLDKKVMDLGLKMRIAIWVGGSLGAGLLAFIFFLIRFVFSHVAGTPPMLGP